MVELRLNSRLRGRVDPSDVVQDAFTEAARVLPEYLAEQPLPVHLWLRRLTSQAILQTHRRHLDTARRDVQREVRFGENREYASVSTDSLALELAGSVASPASEAIQQEQATLLARALEKLSELDREILVLRHFEQLTGGETATILEMTHDAVKKRYLRALIKLRALMPVNESEPDTRGHPSVKPTDD